MKECAPLVHTHFATPLGEMVAVADQKALYLLEFADQHTGRFAGTRRGETTLTQMIQEELALYFEGRLEKFKTPIAMGGTPFQKSVWSALLEIPYGKTCSYAEVAQAIGRPRAVRAGASANRANRLVIVIPCHRVIASGGGLGGYACGLSRKRHLLALEAR